jgi:large subunit ribosomal protein L24
MSKWIRRGDRVIVIAGNEKGKSGEVISRDGDFVVIQDVNLRKKHMRRTEQGGRIVEMEMPLHISNVSLCNKEGVRLSLRVKETKQGKELVYGQDETVHRVVRKG